MYSLQKIAASAALLVLVGACSDGYPAAPNLPSAFAPQTPAYVELDGIVIATGQELTPAAIQLTSGATLPVDGAAVPMLLTVAGARVTVRGREVGNILTVETFIVREVSGRPVADGFLELAQNAYQLRLMDGGTYTIHDAPVTLAQHVGSRIWITSDASLDPVQYGIILDAQ